MQTPGTDCEARIEALLKTVSASEMVCTILLGQLGRQRQELSALVSKPVKENGSAEVSLPNYED